MISPAYSLTATERVLPRMALDFTTGVLDSRVTVTRALNTATRVNSSGFIEVINANLPRFDYDPVTLAPKGLLIEEARTNLTLYSSDFSNAIWSVTNTTKTSTNNADPFGTTTALLLTANGTLNTHLLGTLGLGAVSYTSGTSYTVSYFIKAGTASRVQITMPGSAFGTGQYANFLLTGNGSVTASTGGTATILPAPNGFYRVTWTATATATVAGSVGLIVFITSGTDGRAPTNSSAENFYLAGGQTEAGAFATSYIPTTTTSLTRNADVVQMTGTNFSSWYNASEGTLQILTSLSRDTDNFGAGTLFLDNNNFAAMYFGAVNRPRLLIRNASVFDVNTTAGVAQTSPYNQVMALKNGSISFASNGLLIVNSVNKNIPNPTSLQIGYYPITNSYANAHIQRVCYWPQRLINNEVIAFSKQG